MTDARLISENRVVRVLCPYGANTLIKDGKRTRWVRSALLTSTGVRHRVAEVVQLYPGGDRPCDTEER